MEKKREGTRESEKWLPQGRCNYCTLRRLFKYVRTVGTNLDGTPNGGIRQYSSSLRPHFNCRALAWPREGTPVKRYTALKSTFSLLNFIGRRRAAILSYRAATTVIFMGIPMTAKCSAMQRGRIIRQTAFYPSIAMTFTIVKSRTGSLTTIKPPTVLEFRMVVCRSDAAQRNATQRNATRTHESRTEGSTSSCL